MLKIGLIGTGGIGRTHVDRINNRLTGGRVVAVADPHPDFGRQVAEQLGLTFFEDPAALIEDKEIDALINTTADAFHEQYAMAALTAGKPMFVEKPLAAEAEACRRIVEREMAGEKPLLQVGFMRRYDDGYRQLKEAVDSGNYGLPLLLHCAHRNPSVPDDYDTPMAVENSMIHEIDVLRWLLGEDYRTAEVRFGRDTRRASGSLRDPQTMILTTESGVRIDVEAFVNTGHSYEIKCEIVCEDGILSLPAPPYIEVCRDAFRGRPIDRDWSTRFGEAYDRELQAWINDTAVGRLTGPSAWDGYVAQLTAQAASKARDEQNIQVIDIPEKPGFYRTE